MPFSDMSYHYLPLYGESEENLGDELITEVVFKWQEAIRSMQRGQINVLHILFFMWATLAKCPGEGGRNNLKALWQISP